MGILLQAAKIRTFGPTALVLHSGDVFNPSMLSTITQARAAAASSSSLTAAAAAAADSSHLSSSPVLPDPHPAASSPSVAARLALQGKQMVEVLNCCAIRACCVGNHDLDYGVENFQQRASECSFPWLMANVLDVQTGAPLGGAAPSVLLDWQGIKVGLVGEWVGRSGMLWCVIERARRVGLSQGFRASVG